MNWEIIAAIALACVILGVLAHKYLTAKAVTDAVAKAEASAKKEIAAIYDDVDSWFSKHDAPAAPSPAAAVTAPPAPPAPPTPVDVPSTHAALDQAIADAQAIIDKAKAAKDKLTADVATATAAAVAAIK